MFHTYVEEYRVKHEQHIMKIRREQRADTLTHLLHQHNFGLFSGEFCLTFLGPEGSCVYVNGLDRQIAVRNVSQRNIPLLPPVKTERN